MEQSEEENVLKNENPEFLKDCFNTIIDIFINYGWYLLIVAVGLIYIYIKMYPYIEKFIKDRTEREYSARYHKNSDLFNERQIQMENARKKMQENMIKASNEYKLKMEERELKRRQVLEEKYNNDPDKGHRLGNKNTLKTEYNPLMGSSNGSNYRAPKRNVCGGNKGCGQ